MRVTSNHWVGLLQCLRRLREWEEKKKQKKTHLPAVFMSHRKFKMTCNSKLATLLFLCVVSYGAKVSFKGVEITL